MSSEYTSQLWRHQQILYTYRNILKWSIGQSREHFSCLRHFQAKSFWLHPASKFEWYCLIQPTFKSGWIILSLASQIFRRLLYRSWILIQTPWKIVRMIHRYQSLRRTNRYLQMTITFMLMKVIYHAKSDKFPNFSLFAVPWLWRLNLDPSWSTITLWLSSFTAQFTCFALWFSSTINRWTWRSARLSRISSRNLLK